MSEPHEPPDRDEDEPKREQPQADALSPPPRRNVARSPFLVGVLVAVALALVLFVVGLAVD